MVERLLIHDFLSGSAGALLIDVRSPGEYHHAHIPGAVNIPLFTDEERKTVGTAYKQESREKAIKIGLDMFGPKMRNMVEEVEKLVAQKQSAEAPTPDAHAIHDHHSTKRVFVYCWRGGMRSGAIAWLLDLYGIKVCTLAGGYKSFRNYVLQTFEQPYTFHVVAGYTGSGKTEMIQQLHAMGCRVIDLEKIASHKGSAFGNINMPKQPTQEMFENILGLQLVAVSNAKSTHDRDDLAIWIEDESQRIGDVNIPIQLWNTIRTAPVYFFDIPFEERLHHIVQEYGCLCRDRLSSAIERISKRLGGLETKAALRFLQEGKVHECFRILLTYYDKRYAKGLHNRANLGELLRTIQCDTVSGENAIRLYQEQVI